MNIVQIGSNKGSDDLMHIVLENRSEISKLILVEPLSVHHEQLSRCYQGIPFTIEKIAIVANPNQKEISFYYHRNDGPGYEVASLSREHILKHAYCNPNLTESGIVEEKVPCLTVAQLLDRHQISVVDLLFIDAEGFDDVLIKSIDLNNYNIKNIVYENLHINKNELESYLKDRGYSITPKWGANGWSTWAVKQ